MPLTVKYKRLLRKGQSNREAGSMCWIAIFCKSLFFSFIVVQRGQTQINTATQRNESCAPTLNKSGGLVRKLSRNPPTSALCQILSLLRVFEKQVIKTKIVA